MNRKILIISYWFNPFQAVGTNRITGLAKHLMDCGWDVAVVTVKDSTWAYDGLRHNLDLDINEANVCRTSGFSFSTFVRKISLGKLKGGGQTRKEFAKSKSFSLKKQLFNFYENILVYPDECWPWYWLGRKKALKFTKFFAPDVMLSCAMPGSSHRITSYIHSKTRIPWCADYRDLWSLNHDRVLKPKVKNKLVEYEKEILSSAFMATTVSKGLKSNLSRIFSSSVEVIMNGYDDAVYTASKEPEKLTIVYTGTYYHGKQDVLPLIKSLTALVDQKQIDLKSIEVVFCGNNTDFIRSLVPENIQSVFKFLGLVSKDKVTEMQSSADVLLFLKYPGPGILTGKLFEYIKWQKPILALGEMEEEVDSILSSVNACLCDSLKKISDNIKSWNEEKVKKGKINFISKNTELYSFKNQVGKLSKLLLHEIEK